MTIHVPIREQRDASYDIVIGGALLADLPGLVARHCPAARYAVITDSHVAPLYGALTMSRLRDGGLAAKRAQRVPHIQPQAAERPAAGNTRLRRRP